jgi:hypothetical protein
MGTVIDFASERAKRLSSPPERIDAQWCVFAATAVAGRMISVGEDDLAAAADVLLTPDVVIGAGKDLHAALVAIGMARTFGAGGLYLPISEFRAACQDIHDLRRHLPIGSRRVLRSAWILAAAAERVGATHLVGYPSQYTVRQA